MEKMKQTIWDRPLQAVFRLDIERTLYIILIVLALVTRLWGLGDRVQSHDESIHTKYSWNLYVGHGFQHQPLMHGPFLFHATALSYFLFGDNDFAARVPVALMGVALVAFPFLLRRWLGRTGALVTAFFLLISPSIAYYSRYIRHDIPVALWAMITVWAILSYLYDGRERWLYVMAASVSLAFATKEVAFIYHAIFGFFLIGWFAVEAIRSPRFAEREGLRTMIAAAMGIASLGLFILAVGMLIKPEEQVLAWWAFAGGMAAVLAGVSAVGLLLIAIWPERERYRSFDLIVLLGTLCLPFLSPLAIHIGGWDPLDYGTPTIYYSAAVTLLFVLLSAAIGLWWNWRRWGVAAMIHYAIFVVLFTTVFTNGTGIASGFVGSLGYWLAQQEVERGSQPEYYYVVMVLFYEYLPLLLTLASMAGLAWRSLSRGGRKRIPSPAGQADVRSSSSPFVPFLLWWIVTSWVGYSLAGERMPWLTVHIALPMILLAGWGSGQFVKRIGWHLLRKRCAWLVAFIVLPLLVAGVALVQTVLEGPFQGNALPQLTVTGRFLGALLGVIGFGGALTYIVVRSGRVAWGSIARLAVLVLLLIPILVTVRTAWRFCYVTYDYPTEFLVYAHAAPAVNETMQQIEEISRRAFGGERVIKVAYGSDGSTLWYWQLRNYPNAVFYGEHPSRDQMDAPVVIAGRDQWAAVSPYLERDYTYNTYTYLWWPMEDYRELTWDRIGKMITDPQVRAAMWDIWYDRDYRRYDQLTGKSHTLDQWPLRSDYRLYIRRDVLSRIWGLSVVEPVEELGPTDPYAGRWQDLAARLVFGTEGGAAGEFLRPNGIKIGADGFLYVADTGNHRIQKFTPDGQFVESWGQYSSVELEGGVPLGFNEPWDVAVASDGSIYVADTWNHRIQRRAPDGTVTAWGLFGQYTSADGAVGESAFYGPRGIALSSDGRVYVADTGNKRIQVFDSQGRFAFQWGGGGVLEGYLDEPVGIAVGPDGNVYVADTWNRRVQVFTSDGVYLRQWSIAGWDTGLGDEKPFLAVDRGGNVYVTDPGHYRVLVFDGVGNYLLSFGQYGFDERSFVFPTGIAVSDDGTVYVADSHGHRVLVFDSLGLFDPLAE